MKKTIILGSMLLCIMGYAGCADGKQNKDSGSRFFFPMNEEQTSVEVMCELNYIDAFEGSANLEIRKIPDTKLDNYYEIVLTDLQGKCNHHDSIHNTDCEFSSDFSIGYFYVGEEDIYLMSNYKDYLEIFETVDCFPPTESYIEEWRQNRIEEEETYGYFACRLVCVNEGQEDTYSSEDDNNYHEFITVDNDERRYNLYPEEVMGTQEYMYITWKEEQGIVYFANWSGNRKNYICFWLPEHER